MKKNLAKIVGYGILFDLELNFTNLNQINIDLP